MAKVLKRMNGGENIGYVVSNPKKDVGYNLEGNTRNQSEFLCSLIHRFGRSDSDKVNHSPIDCYARKQIQSATDWYVSTGSTQVSQYVSTGKEKEILTGVHDRFADSGKKDKTEESDGGKEEDSCMSQN